MLYSRNKAREVLCVFLEAVWKEEGHTWCHIVERMMALTIEELRQEFANSGKDQATGIGRTMSLECHAQCAERWHCV